MELGAEVNIRCRSYSVPKVTRAEHRLPRLNIFDIGCFIYCSCLRRYLILREMSYESFSRIVECSHKMIAREVQDHFVPRNELYIMIDILK